MNCGPQFILSLLLVFFSFNVAGAQTSSALDSLRSQLSDLQTKEADLQARIRQLDEDMRPENLEKFFALNGSTHPEKLREQRRRQLETQKTMLQSQLEQVGASRTRLEGLIVTSEAAAYRQSATVADTPGPAVIATKPIKREMKPKQSKRRARRNRVISRKRLG